MTTAIHDATTVLASVTTLTRKRIPQQFPAWAGDHVDDVLSGGAQTLPADGTGEPLVSTIKWEHPDFPSEQPTVDTVIRTFGTSAEHQAAIDAMEDAIEAVGGTVISVT